MTRTDFIATMEAQAEELKAERLSIREMAASDSDAYYRWTKMGHEIAAIENAVREMKRV